MDFTLEIRMPKRDTQVVAGGCSLWPSSQISARDIDPWLTEQQIQEIAWRKIRSLQVAADGPNRYDRILMAIRKIVATRPPDRRQLLNGQVDEFLAEYVMPYGPRLGRWYFTRKVLDESRRVSRKLGLLGGVVAALGAILRWIAGRG